MIALRAVVAACTGPHVDVARHALYRHDAWIETFRWDERHGGEVVVTVRLTGRNDLARIEVVSDALERVGCRVRPSSVPPAPEGP